MDLTSLPRPQRLDRIRCINPEMKEFFAEGGVLIHAAANPQVACTVVFDKSPRAHAILFAKDFISEIYAKEIDFRALARDYVPPVAETAPSFNAPVMAPIKRRGRPPKVSAVETVNAPQKAPKAPKAIVEKVAGTGHRGRAKTTVVLTPELIAAAIQAYNSGRGMVEVCKEMNISPLEIRPAFVAAGIELRKGRRSV